MNIFLSNKFWLQQWASWTSQASFAIRSCSRSFWKRSFNYERILAFYLLRTYFKFWTCLNLKSLVMIFRYPLGWIKKNWQNLGVAPLPCPILCIVIFDYWETWLKLVMFEHVQTCLNKWFFFCFQHYISPKWASWTSPASFAKWSCSRSIWGR